mmetsp:Transcript_3375/g.7537  ORF Transcript_3375/g.7537 Transcript_3375/m.7537 type:complete len:224 (-) Transcript_3375:420-1091(-)
MAEMASVASEPTSKAATSSLERFNTRESTVSNPKGVEFASNILNDMGPPAQLCSALLLAANAACRPSSRSSLRSFDTDNDGDAPSDVVAHVDTDDCCDRSIIESEACSLHSQEDTGSIHKEGYLDESARCAGNIESIGNDPLRDPSSPSSTGNGRDIREEYKREAYYDPLERFCRQGQVEVDTADGGNLLGDGTGLSHLPDRDCNAWNREYFDQGREDDWSNR